VTVRINGGAIGKAKEECRIEFLENAVFLEDIVKQACKKLGAKGKEKQCKIYDKNGVNLQEDDMQFIQPEDIIYIALEGKILLPMTCVQVSLLIFPQRFLTTILSTNYSARAATAKCI
jgi:hypothetical protein